MVLTNITIKRERKTSFCACMTIINAQSSLYTNFFFLLFHFFSSPYSFVSISHDHIELLFQFLHKKHKHNSEIS
jgi:hypothetical protein